MKDDNRINLLHLWSVHHPRDFVRRVEDLLTDLYERVERLEENCCGTAKKGLTEEKGARKK